MQMEVTFTYAPCYSCLQSTLDNVSFPFYATNLTITATSTAILQKKNSRIAQEKTPDTAKYVKCIRKGKPINCK